MSFEAAGPGKLWEWGLNYIQKSGGRRQEWESNEPILTDQSRKSTENTEVAK